jgi:hypothetical protein
MDEPWQDEMDTAMKHCFTAAAMAASAGLPCGGASFQAFAAVIASVSENNPALPQKILDCFVAEPVIGRTCARPVGSSQ